MKIKVGSYKTHNGLTALVFYTDWNGTFPILGKLQNHDGFWVDASWTSRGRFFSGDDDSGFDLVIESHTETTGEQVQSPTKFEVGKEYKTRDGQTARIYATDGNGDYPIHGAINDGDGWQVAKWTSEGTAFSFDPDTEGGEDLMSEQQSINVYLLSDGLVIATRENLTQSGTIVGSAVLVPGEFID